MSYEPFFVFWDYVPQELSSLLKAAAGRSSHPVCEKNLRAVPIMSRTAKHAQAAATSTSPPRPSRQRHGPSDTVAKPTDVTHVRMSSFAMSFWRAVTTTNGENFCRRALSIANSIKTQENTKWTRNKHTHATLGQRRLPGKNYAQISGSKGLWWRQEHVHCQPPIPGTPHASNMQRMYHEETTRNWAYISPLCK